jgi:hypothetical protein
MLKISAASIIQLLTEQYFKANKINRVDGITSPHTRTTNGIAFGLDVRERYAIPGVETVDGDRIEYTDSINVFFVICDRHRVFFQASEDVYCLMPYLKRLPSAEWKQTSYHDSCWRSDGIESPISSVYFKLANNINKAMESAGHPKVAPINIDVDTYLKIAGEPVTVTYVNDQKRNTHGSEYFKSIISIVPVVE